MSQQQHRGGKAPYKKHPSGESSHRGDLNSKVKQISDVFPEWRKEEISRCLEENNYDVEAVIEKKMEGKEDWKTVEVASRQRTSQRGRGRGRGGNRGGNRGTRSGEGHRPSSPSQAQSSSSTDDKPIKKTRPAKQDKTTSSEVRNFSESQSPAVEEKPAVPQKLSYSEAAALSKKKEEDEKKKVDDEKNKQEQQAKALQEQAKERNQQKRNKKKAPKEEVKEHVVEPVVEPQVVEVVEEVAVEDEEIVQSAADGGVALDTAEEDAGQEVVHQETQEQSYQQHLPVHSEPLQMPSNVYSNAVALQFGTLDLGSQTKTQPHTASNVNQSTQGNQMQNGQFWSDPKNMQHNYMPYMPNQFPYPQYYPYIYQYYQPQTGQGVNAGNKNFTQGGYYQEGFNMYNQAGVSGNEETEQTQEQYQYQMQQPPYFFMYPQQQQQLDNKHTKSESSQQSDPKMSYPQYLPGGVNPYQTPQYQSYVYPNQMMFGQPHYPASNTNTSGNTSNANPAAKKW